MNLRRLPLVGLEAGAPPLVVFSRREVTKVLLVCALGGFAAGFLFATYLIAYAVIKT